MPKRNENDPRFQWDLSPIYPDTDAWEADFAQATNLIRALPTLQGTLGTSVESLIRACETLDKAEEKAERVYLYASLLKSLDSGNSASQAMEARCMGMLTEFSTACSFWESELLSIPEETFSAWLKDPRLADWRHNLEDTARSRAHVLDAAQERLLAMLTDAATTPENAYTMLSDVEMRYPDITDADGNALPLTAGNFGVYRENKDRSIRVQAFEHLFGAYRSHIDTCAALYAGQVKLDSFYAKARNYESPCAQSLFGSNVPMSVYESLIEAMHSSLPTMRRYLELRKRVLSLPDADMMDLYVPMVKNAEMKVPFEDGKALVKKALQPLGEEYAALLDRAFAEKWIDVYENEGKTTGAFSCGVYGVHPYVLLNYTDTLDDAFTLAHELGHAMHSFFSDRTQPHPIHSYATMVAEVASTVNEVLLTMYLLKTETDRDRRAAILNHFLEGFRTTVFRQTLFAEFEKKAHEMYDAGTPLTAENLNALYRSLNELYYEGVGIPEVYDVEWAYIPHFYSSFYVYQYATGFCTAVAIARRILDTGDASGYLKFLTTGGSDYPIEELKTVGIDLTKPDTVESAMQVFADTVAEMERLL